MDKLTGLKVFSVVAECGSFTEAAKNLNLTRGAVSRYINDVEAWLGTRLLHRSTREISLTRAGEDCLVKARELVELGGALQEEVGDQSKIARGTLRVTCAISFGSNVLVPLVAEFLKDHDELNIELLLTDRSSDLVAEGIDLAITMTNNLDPNCIAHPLLSCASVIVASERYLSAHQNIEKPEDLTQHNCLSHVYYGSKVWRFEREGEHQEIKIKGQFKANDALAIGRAAVSGLGVALLPSYVANPLIETGQVKALLTEYSTMPVGVFCVYRSRVRIPASLKQLICFLRQRLNHDQLDVIAVSKSSL